MSKPYDAILVPGGGLTERGGLPEWTRRRLKAALEMHADEHIVVLSGGTVHKPPPLDDAHHVIFECSAAAAYLLENGIQPEKILREWSSYDTIGNAYFARVVHTDPRQWRNLAIITSDFHMSRVREIFEWVFSLDPTDRAYRLEFVGVTDKGIDPETLEPRIAREKQALEMLLPLKERIRSLRDFHIWLFEEHEAYAVAGNPNRAQGRVLRSY